MLKNRKLKIFIITVIAFTMIFPFNYFGCSMIKVTKNGKTIVGNNEDQMNPNTRIWFETGKNGKYGAVYVGFHNLFPQGGMNEAGLAYDGFTQSYRAVVDTAGKLKISSRDLPKKLLQECTTVEEVKRQISKYNISFLSASVLRFIDKTGKYLYVDGDSLILGEKDYFVQTNVRPYENKKCWRLEKATGLLEKSNDATVDYVKSVMDSIHQDAKVVKTVYSTVYDLNDCKVYLYHFFDFNRVVTFDLKEELKKGDRVLNIPDLFPENVAGKKYYNEYNKIVTQIKKLGETPAADAERDIKTILNDMKNSFIENDPFYVKTLDNIQYYLNEEINYPRAIIYCKLACEIYPDYWQGYSALGAAYLKNKQYKLALDNYKRSVELNPKNEDGRKQIEQIKKLTDKL